MAEKIFRDPLYNYISIDRDTDGWLLKLIDTREVQRLRRIHQLGISNFTYPGAEHTRFSHSLGVVHLMQQALTHAKSSGYEDSAVRRAHEPLLAAAMLHDVGHGPFSHLFEPCLGTKHEDWTVKIIESEETEVHQELKKGDIAPSDVVDLIKKPRDPSTAWQHNLISSQLDVDRLDYLRRDSLFTGAGYGHFDYFRLLHTFAIHEEDNGYRDLVWMEKAKFAIEEYIFARFYMYQNVYMHKTTRGYEKLLQKMWERVRGKHDAGDKQGLLAPIKAFWGSKKPTVDKYLALTEAVVLLQIEQWTRSKDRALADLARRFLCRKGFVAIDAPGAESDWELDAPKFERALRELVGKHKEYDPVDAYVLKDDFETTVYSVYEPERDAEETSPINAIRIKLDASDPPRG